LIDHAIFDNCRQAEDVTANGVGYFDRVGGVGEFACIAGILEVIEELRGEHLESMAWVERK
jgi:hypothetical protein